MKSYPVMWGVFHEPWNKDPYQTTSISMESKGPRVFWAVAQLALHRSSSSPKIKIKSGSIWFQTTVGQIIATSHNLTSLRKGNPLISGKSRVVNYYKFGQRIGVFLDFVEWFLIYTPGSTNKSLAGMTGPWMSRCMDPLVYQSQLMLGNTRGYPKTPPPPPTKKRNEDNNMQ